MAYRHYRRRISNWQERDAEALKILLFVLAHIIQLYFVKLYLSRSIVIDRNNIFFLDLFTQHYDLAGNIFKLDTDSSSN